MFDIKERMLPKIIIRLLIFISTLLLLISCDGAARVKGRLAISEATLDNCSLSLFIKRTNTLIYKFEISKEFNIDFTISPWEKEYFIVINCNGCIPYKTETYKMGGTKYFDNPLNLGTIELRRKE